MADSKFLRKLFHTFFLFTRPMTLGVRVIVENDKREVLLVKHTYVEGWYLPGGGVETGETLAQTTTKELQEETGIEVLELPELISIHKNNSASKRDHVVLFKVMKWHQAEAFTPNKEIKEIGFFAIDDLPADITKGNLNRLQEVYFNQVPSEYW